MCSAASGNDDFIMTTEWGRAAFTALKRRSGAAFWQHSGGSLEKALLLMESHQHSKDLKRPSGSSDPSPPEVP